MINLVSRAQPNQSKQVQRWKATQTTKPMTCTQILQSLPLWHRDTKKAERSPTTQVVAQAENDSSSPDSAAGTYSSSESVHL